MPTPRKTRTPANLTAFDVSPERGFLPDPDPSIALPDGFAPWEEVARDLPKLLLAGRIRETIEALPSLSVDALREEASLRRAMVILSYLGHAYVWGEASSADRIPAVIAVPWYRVAGRLGRHPVLSYASYALDNWRRLDPADPVELGNIAIVQNFLGGGDEDWFIAVHVEIEAKAGTVLRAIGPAIAAAERGDAKALTARLEDIGAGLEAMVGVLRRMPEHCDPYIYFTRVRPYLHGWQDNPVLPEGVVYEGVEEFGGRPQRFRGETGAQSSIVPALDAVLGIGHAEDPLSRYLVEMRDYMPPGHRAFVAAIENSAPLRSKVLEEAQGDTGLRQAYNHCVDRLGRFRSTHLEFADGYIHRQAQARSGNPTAVGTGGTPFMDYLRKHRDETLAHRIS